MPLDKNKILLAFKSMVEAGVISITSDEETLEDWVEQISTLDEEDLGGEIQTEPATAPSEVPTTRAEAYNRVPSEEIMWNLLQPFPGFPDSPRSSSVRTRHDVELLN